MIARSTLLDALQFDLAVTDPLHADTDPARVFTWQFESAQPADLWDAYTGWTPLSVAEREAVRDALAHVETILNVDFVELAFAADPDLNFGKVSIPGTTAGYGGYRYFYSGDTITEYDGYAVFDATIDLSGETSLILHELGHALSLKHPFEGATVLPDALDSNKFTVMSYDANPDNGLDSDALMLFDIYALQARWGANMATAAGDDTYTGPRTDTIDAIWDTGGEDWFDASARTGDVALDLRAGRFSQFGAIEDVAIAYGVRIEHAAGGSGDDVIRGNKASNTLDGNDGRDRLKGYEGRDVLLGEGGVDRLTADEGRDRLLGGAKRDFLEGGEGNDVLVGGGGRDSFIFTPGMDIDIVLRIQDDFDILQFEGFGSEAVIAAAAVQAGSDVRIDLGGGDRVVIRDALLAEVTDDILAL